MWNQAHPEDVVDSAGLDTNVSLAKVVCQVTVRENEAVVVITGDITSYRKEQMILPLPISGLAVTEVMTGA